MLALLTYAFPGGENIGLGFGLLPGMVWLGNGASTPLLIAAGSFTMLSLGALADWRRVRLVSWSRSLLFFACLTACVLAIPLLGESDEHITLVVDALNKFQVSYAISLLLMCFAGGLYIGTAFAIILTLKTNEIRQA